MRRAARARRAAIPVRVPTPALAALLMLPLLVGATMPAAAHAILMASDPPVQGQLAAGTATVTLRYNSRVDHARSSLVLTRPDGSTERLPVAGGSPSDALATRVALVPGAYSLRWQVLATDGHITRGDVPFTVLPGDAAAVGVASAGAAPAGATAGGAVPAGMAQAGAARTATKGP